MISRLIRGVGQETIIDGVVLLHGIARRARSLAKMERALKASGYLTLNLDYPSRRFGLGALADFVRDPVFQFMGGIDGRLHFVTHSMGGLVARAFINRHRPDNLGRVVALAPPNGGSEVADFLRRNPLYKRYFGPAGAQLTTTRDDDLRELLGEIDYQYGVIAGNRTIDPVSSLLIPQPNDGRVSVASTRAAGMTDHITLHATHAFIMSNQAVIRQTLHFLRRGHF